MPLAQKVNLTRYSTVYRDMCKKCSLDRNVLDKYLTMSDCEGNMPNVRKTLKLFNMMGVTPALNDHTLVLIKQVFYGIAGKYTVTPLITGIRCVKQMSAVSQKIGLTYSIDLAIFRDKVPNDWELRNGLLLLGAIKNIDKELLRLRTHMCMIRYLSDYLYSYTACMLSNNEMVWEFIDLQECINEIWCNVDHAKLYIDRNAGCEVNTLVPYFMPTKVLNSNGVWDNITVT